jgi:hypothetical protein
MMAVDKNVRSMKFIKSVVMYKYFFIIFLLISLKGKGQPIFITDQTLLYSVDINSCSTRLVGNTDQLFNDIALTPDGKLWGIYIGKLYSIDTATAKVTYIGFSRRNLGSSLVALSDSVLMDEWKGKLVALNVHTLQSVTLGKLGEQSLGDLAWYDNDLYMCAGPLLFKIILDSINNTVTSVTAINDFNHQIPVCQALATASFPGFANSLVGWDEGNGTAYKICPFDASYEQICEPIGFGPQGAASMRLPVQDPLPVSCSQILPVHYFNFTYFTVNNAVKLQWQTAREINSNYFVIERSVDGINFSPIGKVNASGNSNLLKEYSFVDDAPLGENYYRLKEVDLDGAVSYSKILQVKMRQAEALNIIGNPVQNVLHLQINVSLSQANYLSVFDFTGRRLKTFNVQNGIQDIDVSFIPSGTYVLQLIASDGKEYNKVFVKK